MKTIYLIDSNILVYALNSKSEYHKRALRIIQQAFSGKVEACVAPQNLYEAYAVITDPRRVEKPLTPSQAITALRSNYLNNPVLKKIYPRLTTPVTVFDLLKKHGVKSQGIFDLVLVATMIDNGIKGIYTLDTKRFKRFKFFEVIGI